jgi:hypothetical protein
LVGIRTPLNPTSLNQFGIPEFTATGNAWMRFPQLRVESKTANSGGNNFLWQFAVSDPDMGDYSTAAISVARQPGIGERGRMPSLESRLAWTATQDDRDYTIGLSGQYGRGKNAGIAGGVEVEPPVDSWGVAVDYSLPVSKFFHLTGEAYEGRALGIYAVASGEDVGAVATAGAHGVLSRGGWAQAQFNFSKQWQFNLAYGIDNPEASELPVGARNRNQQYMANIIDKLTRNINASLEYRRILTDYRNQLGSITTSRLSTTISVFADFTGSPSIPMNDKLYVPLGTSRKSNLRSGGRGEACKNSTGDSSSSGGCGGPIHRVYDRTFVC